ncbi:transposase [Shouchella shacheensis]|uniref:transposase n=1 Tax=Shouchella shacheensis TaxID=1649580 RepID=UPI0007400A9B
MQDGFPERKKTYWGQHLWARGHFCTTVGNMTEEMIGNYTVNQSEKEKNEIFEVEE